LKKGGGLTLRLLITSLTPKGESSGNSKEMEEESSRIGGNPARPREKTRKPADDEKKTFTAKEDGGGSTENPTANY